jgi:ankyrin repeat protein
MIAFVLNLGRNMRFKTFGFLAFAGLCAAQSNELFEAARTGDLPTLQSLAADKKIIDRRDANGRTALHEAASNCQLAAARILVAAGWSRTLTDDQRRTPLTLSSECPGDIQPLFRALLTPPVRESDPWSLQYASGRHQASVVSMLLKMRVDVNAPGSEGNRALDIACLKGDVEVARLLLEHGARPELRNKTGATPLHDAALSGNKEVIEVLLMHGADVNAIDSESRSTPLHYAAEFDRLDAAVALVRHGADMTLKNANGLTALEVARKYNFDDISGFLGSAATRR